MRRLRPQIQRHFDRSLDSLSDEFAAEVEADAIRRAGGQRLSYFLTQARFDDFIPVLVHRNVRERILERLAEQRQVLASRQPR